MPEKNLEKIADFSCIFDNFCHFLQFFEKMPEK
jgi:hypothetical protein